MACFTTLNLMLYYVFGQHKRFAGEKFGNDVMRSMMSADSLDIGKFRHFAGKIQTAYRWSRV